MRKRTPFHYPDGTPIEHLRAPRPRVLPAPAPSSGLADSGARAESVTGGLREPKAVSDGRFDLIPPFCIARVLAQEPRDITPARLHLCEYLDVPGRKDERDRDRLESTFGRINPADHLAIFARAVLQMAGSLDAGLRRLAIHYAKGSVKYTRVVDGVTISGDRNWEKGIDTSQTVSSLQRHLVKLVAGHDDEDHLAAVVWNTFCLMHHEREILAGRLPRELDTYGIAA